MKLHHHLILLTVTCVLAIAAPAVADTLPTSITKSVLHSKGVVLIVHGGGWRPSNPTYMRLMAPAANVFNDAGWSTRIQAEHGGRQSFLDVMRSALSLKKTIKARPLCIYGRSSGGQMALLTAAALGKSVTCVITEAAPTWLDLAPDTGDHAYVRRMATAAFGADSLRAFSPLSYAAQTTAKVFMVYAQNDPLIPTWQTQSYSNLKPGTKTVSLAAGNIAWVHSKVSKSAVIAAGKKSLKFLNSFG